jgi:hypothetical protein
MLPSIYRLYGTEIYLEMTILSVISGHNIMNNDKLEMKLFSPGGTAYGLTYSEWAIKWWQRMFSICHDNNPVIDDSGKNCRYKQSGPVWFLAGTVISSRVFRHCSIPDGKAILFPIINTERSTAELPCASNSQLIEAAKYDIDQVSRLGVTIDGAKLEHLDEYRTSTPPFYLKIPKDNFMGLKHGNTIAVSDGFWIILKPMPIGNHVIHFIGIDPNLQLDVTYNVVVGEVTYMNDIITVVLEEIKKRIPIIHHEFDVTIDQRDIFDIEEILRAAIPSLEMAGILLRNRIDRVKIIDNIDRLLCSAAEIARKDKRAQLKPSDLTNALVEIDTSKSLPWPFCLE